MISAAHERCKELAIEQLEDEGLVRSSELFFPVITYPPPVGLPRWSEAQMFRDALDFNRENFTLYVHIPFCLTRCVFCHWVVTLGSDEERVQRYLDALNREFTAFSRRLGGGPRLRPTSVLIGGGTPTYPVARQMDTFFQLLHKHFDLSACQQFSMEAEPSTLLGAEGDARLAVMREHGVDRVSMGVQAFHDRLLKGLGRVHDSATALRAIERLHEAGIPSVSIDLIYGLPNQTLEDWLETMQTAISSGADAWQLYRLRILPHGDKPGKIIEQYKKQQDRFPHMDDVYIMKMLGWNISEENGFRQHYTRIFARSPQHISYYLHDVNDKLLDVAGFGISSWSNIGRTFTQNIGNDFHRYYEETEQDRLPVDRGLRRDEDDEMRRDFILPLKNTQVDLKRFRASTGHDPHHTSLTEPLQRMTKLGLLEQDGDFIRMTHRGRFFADEVAMQFFAHRYLPQRELAHSSAID